MNSFEHFDGGDDESEEQAEEPKLNSAFTHSNFSRAPRTTFNKNDKPPTTIKNPKSEMKMSKGSDADEARGAASKVTAEHVALSTAIEYRNKHPPKILESAIKSGALFSNSVPALMLKR